jgi:LysM repeat protein
MLPFLFLNVVVSAVVVLGILFWWDSRRPDEAIAVAPTAVALINPAGSSATAPPAAPDGAVAPDAAESSAPDAAADDGPPVHTVAAGETLGIISNTYEVSIDDIMEANGLDNPDLISVGQQLIIPVGGIPVATATVEVTVARPSPIPTEPAAAAGDNTAEIEVAAVEGVGVLAEEAVQIVNTGLSEQAMLGWKVRDEDSNVYTFGDIRIFGEGAGIRLHTRSGANTSADLFWGLSEPAWRSGEVLTLWDAADQVVARFVIP